VAEGQQVSGSLRAGAVGIRRNPGERALGGIHDHHVHPLEQGARLGVFGDGGGHEYAIHLPIAKALEVHVGRNLTRITEKDPVPGLGGNPIGSAHNPRKERVVEGGGDDANGKRPALDQPAGEQIRAIPQIPGCSKDPFAGRGRDSGARVSGEDKGDGGL
jgi:hypothetical protein